MLTTPVVLQSCIPVSSSCTARPTLIWILPKAPSFKWKFYCVQVSLAVRRDAASLHGFQAGGGFTRITSLLQWAALTFGGTADGAAEPQGSTAQRDGVNPDTTAASPAAASGARQLSSSTSDAVISATAAGPAPATAPAPHAGTPVDSMGGPRLPLLPSPLRTPATSRRLDGGQPSLDALPGSPLAHPSPTALQRLDSARVSPEGSAASWLSSTCLHRNVAINGRLSTQLSLVVLSVMYPAVLLWHFCMLAMR